MPAVSPGINSSPHPHVSARLPAATTPKRSAHESLGIRRRCRALRLRSGQHRRTNYENQIPGNRGRRVRRREASQPTRGPRHGSEWNRSAGGAGSAGRACPGRTGRPRARTRRRARRCGRCWAPGRSSIGPMTTIAGHDQARGTAPPGRDASSIAAVRARPAPSMAAQGRTKRFTAGLCRSFIAGPAGR